MYSKSQMANFNTQDFTLFFSTLLQEDVGSMRVVYGQLLGFQKNPNATAEVLRSKNGLITMPDAKDWIHDLVTGTWRCFPAPLISTSDANF